MPQSARAPGGLPPGRVPVQRFRTIDHPRYHELREVGEFNLDDWNWDRKCERERAHRAEVEEMRWRIEEARSFFDPEFFM